MVPKVLKEAIPTSNCTHIPVQQVKDIAFLFHADEIQSGKYRPGGVNNGYLVRRCRGLKGQTRKLNSFNAFRNQNGFRWRI